jgi:hypothetical protein
MKQTLEVISIEDAAQLKGVSTKAIYAAIKRGDLVRLNGIPIYSLAGYVPDPKQQLIGRRRQARQRLDNSRTKREDSQ